jgi:2'-5' RNA ligase
MKLTMRLFIALDLPSAVVQKLESLLDTLRPTARISWVQPANMHITLKFIGEFPEERIPELTAALDHILKPGAIPLAVRELGFFPNPRSPRVFWVGVEAPGLAELASEIDRTTAKFGVEPEKRAFSPHLTLARIKDRLNLKPLQDAIAAMPSRDFGRFDVNSFYVYRSQLRPTGAIYTKLAEFTLAK